MRLVLLDHPNPKRFHFDPLALSRPIFALRSGMKTLGEKLEARFEPQSVAWIIPDYMVEAWRPQTPWPINDLTVLREGNDDLLIVHGRVKARGWEYDPLGSSEVILDEDGQVLVARVARSDLGKLCYDSIEAFVRSLAESLPHRSHQIPTWNYIWELVLENPDQLRQDFAALGRFGIEGNVEQPLALRGDRDDLYIAPGVQIHPMVVIDVTGGPVYIDADAEIHPFTRIEGPCYIGKRTILLGAKCREGNTIGPVCRVGGEIEESIIQGYSNKYHDGFLGHAYVGEWVNLGALTTNSDLKNDYSSVEVILDGKRPIPTGSTKVGSLIGDHTKTSIGTLLNTGAYVGAMTVIMATGKPLPKFIPSFAWFLDGHLSKGYGKQALYKTAAVAMSRRRCTWTPAMEKMWDAIYQLTAPVRDELIRKARRTAIGTESGKRA
ncbi:MAG: putative sugar nucleotidyl transferase [Thermoguttaceae bacterium]|nr:putative sugar nucleotidyl transferase [Thermoguttaceae bacterium]MDW8077410.1 putative sugar nucleotidyl transferase [Thermoguttaceae bacterium]